MSTNEPPNWGLLILLNLINLTAKYPNSDVRFQKFDAITQEGRPRKGGCNTMKKQFQLFAKSAKNGQRLKSFEVVQGRGEEGAALRIQAESGTRYELFDAELQRAPC
jgi:hypothetical protein